MFRHGEKKMKKKLRIFSLLILCSLFLVLIPIQNGYGKDVLFSETFDSTTSSWPWSSYGGNWYKANDLLYGNGTTTGWDSLVLDTPIFNETEYTVLFKVYIDAGYGSEQFHICFAYDLWEFRLELGSEYGASHYIFNVSSTDLNYLIPLNKWVQVHVISSGEELKIWVDGFQIDPGTYLPAHPLKKFSFGIFDGSHVGFDDLTIFKGKEPPVSIGPSMIFDDNYDRPDDSPLVPKYILNAGEWRIDGSRLIGDNLGDDWSTCTTDVVFPLQDVTIEFDYDFINYNESFSALSFELTSDPNGRRFIDFYQDGNVWYSNRVGEPEHSLSPVLSPLPLSGHISIVIDANTWFKIYHHNVFLGEFGIPLRNSGNIGFGVHSAKIAFDNLYVRSGQHYPGDPTDPSNFTKYWGISVGDKFEYLLSEYVGSKTEFDTGNWFQSQTSTSTSSSNAMTNPPPTSFFIQEGDELTVSVSALLEHAVEVEVSLNDEPSIKVLTSFFFLPIHDLGRSKMFNQDFVDVGDYYQITLYDNTSGTGAGSGSSLGEVTILWEKATGALKSVELMFGEYAVDPLRENVITSFLFELTGSKIAEKSDDVPATIELTPGFEWLIGLGIVALLPLGKKRFKK